MKLEELEKKLVETYNKHNLDFEELDNEFEIIDAFYSRKITGYFLRNTRRRIIEVLYSYINYLHNFVAPNPQSVILMQEAEFFSDEEKDEIDAVMKKIMLVNRMSIRLDLEPDEENDAEFIKQSLDEWKKLKPKIVEITNKLIENWKKNK
jgi:hypothetical protein